MRLKDGRCGLLDPIGLEAIQSVEAYAVDIFQHSAIDVEHHFERTPSSPLLNVSFVIASRKPPCHTRVAHRVRRNTGQGVTLGELPNYRFVPPLANGVVVTHRTARTDKDVLTAFTQIATETPYQ